MSYYNQENKPTDIIVLENANTHERRTYTVEELICTDKVSVGDKIKAFKKFVQEQTSKNQSLEERLDAVEETNLKLIEILNDMNKNASMTQVDVDILKTELEALK